MSDTRDLTIADKKRMDEVRRILIETVDERVQYPSKLAKLLQAQEKLNQLVGLVFSREL